jgi:hypothetical protein
MGQLINDFVKRISEGEATVSLREGWKTLYNSYPSMDSLSLLWAQWALETGRGKAIHCYNFGNIKKRYANPKYGITDDGHNWCMFRCSEIINGKEIWFDPPHIQTHFRAYDSAIEGATDYIKFVSQRKRYQAAWQQVLAGSPVGYAHELKKAGYYTASETLYTKGIVKLTDEFKTKYPKLIQWTPPTDVVPPIVPESIPENKELFTDNEKQQILGVINLSLDQAVDEYFARTDRLDEDQEENKV